MHERASVLAQHVACARVKGFLCLAFARVSQVIASHSVGQLPAAAIDLAAVSVDARRSSPPVRLRPQARGDQQCDGSSPRG